MKKTLLLLCFLSQAYVFAQSPSDLFNAGRNISRNTVSDKPDKRFFSTAELDFGVANEVTYSYSLYDHRGDFQGGRSAELDNKASFGLLYSINYPLLNKLTLGAVGGFQHQLQQSVSALKFGGILRYHFVDYESTNINLMTAYNLALSDNIESDMANVRLGLQFPITRTDDFNLNMNVFWDYNMYTAKGEPIMNEEFEEPSSLLFRAYGISLGLLF